MPLLKFITTQLKALVGIKTDPTVIHKCITSLVKSNGSKISAFIKSFTINIKDEGIKVKEN